MAWYALGGAAALVLPGWLHGASPDPLWSAVALSLAILGMRFRQRQPFLRCLLAIGLGLAIDFARIPPFAMEALCGANRGVLATMLAHVHLFPATSALMLLMALPNWRAPPGLAYLVRLAENMVFMLLATTLAMLLLQESARLLALNWSSEAWACAMTAGMAAYKPRR